LVTNDHQQRRKGDPLVPGPSPSVDNSAKGVDQVTYDDVSTILGAPLSEIKIEDRSHALRGAQILARCLSLEGVDVLFGYPGGANLEIFDVLEDYGIRCIRVEHEQGAAHAARRFRARNWKCGRLPSDLGSRSYESRDWHR
jgi:acetolactate synthase I/II/III large subunit